MQSEQSGTSGRWGGGYLRRQISVATTPFFSLQVCVLRTVEACGLKIFFLIRANLNVPPFCFNYTLNQVFHVWNWKLLYGLISFFPSFFFPEAGFYLKSLGDIFWYFCSRASNHLLLIKKENEVCRKKEKKKIIFINWYFWAIGLLQGLFWNIFWSQRTIHFLSINLKRLYILT